MKRHLVYIVQEALGGPFKVGYSVRHPKHGRLGRLQTGNPRRLEIRRVYYGFADKGEAMRAEGRLQDALEPARMAGEWFREEAFRHADKLAADWGWKRWG